MRFILLVLLFIFVERVNSWNEAPASVLLREVQVLTLYKGHYTTARRSSPVPQLKCIGGSADCGAFVPEAVQCKNKGWDGVDVQWECKTDMDNAYRFGRIEVTCEGYSHPDDAYILKGSCGLEYTLELTEEGRAKRTDSHYGSKQSGGFGDFASNFFSGFSSNKHHHHGTHQKHQSSSPEGTGSMLGVAILLFIAYGVYKLFLSGNSSQGVHQESEQDSYPRGNDYSDYTNGPPPPGFKPNFTGPSSGYPGPPPDYGFRSDSSYGQHYPRHRGAAPGAGGSFWTGLGTGGVLGYLFGGQRNQGYGYNHTMHTHRPPPFTRDPSSSSGTRTASGFGGTKRR